mmetsp:Transcript_41529/g.60901  ORF Transcript_41529/g.60901 Transcript_41529/m.60901 type:complete len:290 (-) Transcript_41529:44-913(-)|eukprot:CAMPEP_0195519074 /NCGR_PEP_ID=MMETSP0794_2-20130614/14320_1 /TAXON_ID=515487 /ORGANISM="Stephanopyxis turris, Strain CCMP 815" /LENGTH=289 /DNA_ID=CAMNT_0040648171 /DNA_START=140 /DNA_END=1009 /DNA_ORIENTATION=+
MNRKRKANELDNKQQFSCNRERQWLNRYKELYKYKADHGDCLVPRNFRPNPQLGRWVNLQRKDYKTKTEGKKSPMSKVRISLLEELGFAWVGVKTVWEERFEELKKYKAEYGDCLVPQAFQPNPKLGQWVNAQRKDYKVMKEGKSSPMNQKRVSMLVGLGFVWSVERSWYKRLEELKLYKLEHGDCLVPFHYKQNPPLGRWVHVQRKNWKLNREGKKSALNSERFDLLEKVGFKWNALEAEKKVQNVKKEIPRASFPTATDQEALLRLELDGVIGLALFQENAKNLICC